MKACIALVLLLIGMGCKKDPPLYEVVNVKISAAAKEYIEQLTPVSETAVVLRAHVNEPTDATLGVYNRWGETLYTTKVSISAATLDIPLNASAWPDGVYFAQLSYGKGSKLSCQLKLAR